MSRKRLADDVRLDIDYEDETPFGSALGGGADAALRQACASIFQPETPRGMDYLVRRSKELLDLAFTRDLASRYVKPGVLREECLFPPAEKVRPRALVVTRESNVLVALDVPREVLGELARWIEELQRGTRRPSAGVFRDLFDLLEQYGALTSDAVAHEPPPEADVVLVGHATALLAGGERVLVDPYLLPTSPRYSASYQPLRIGDLLPLDGIFITHSHPDHFDPGTLLRLGADTPIYVPEVERESLLAVDMGMRLEQLGFSKVRRIRPGAELALGKTTVHALPFFGEQPTTGECLHPDVRNVGCTYAFESNGKRVLMIADSGRDRDGDVRDLAALARRTWGDIDVLLGGYRGFALYPLQYLFSSVARYLLFVPESERTVRQVAMNDSDALIDTGERCGAKHIVPYADGGAPWYWERGLGPQLDGHGISRPAVDPPPDDVLHRAAARSSSIDETIGSPANVTLLRPGEGLALTADGSSQILRSPRQVWPYGKRRWHQRNVVLVRSSGSAWDSARAIFRALSPAIEAWRREGRLERFFFMRKPPDLRLRFFGADTLSDEISALLERLARDGKIERSFECIYEPETERFGGKKAMDAVHAWFDVDATAWMRLDAVASEGRDVIAADLLVCAVADDLVPQLLTDPAEVTAMWRSYASSFALEPNATAPPLSPVDVETLGTSTSPELRDVLASYRQANRVLATELHALLEAGELSAGIRSVAAAVVLFHLHRHGFDPSGHARIVWTMLERHG